MSARSRDSRTHTPSSCGHSVVEQEQRGHFEVGQWQVPLRSNSNYVRRTARVNPGLTLTLWLSLVM